MNKNSDLIIPVYLNQRLVFDLVAMLEDGIATVTRVVDRTAESNLSATSASAGLGLNRALESLLRVDLSAKGATSTGREKAGEVSKERVHTPASLLYLLRALLKEKGVIDVVSKDKWPSPGAIVEFTASLKRNPLIEGLDTMVQVMDLLTVFINSDKGGSPSRKSGKGGSRNNQYSDLRKQLTMLSDSLKAGGSQDMVAYLSSDIGRAIVTVEEAFLNDPMMADLVDGTFRVIGKVVSSEVDEDRSVNLLRKTAMSRVPESLLDTVTHALEGLHSEHGFDLPKMEVKINGPVFQLIPIAIFS